MPRDHSSDGRHAPSYQEVRPVRELITEQEMMVALNYGDRTAEEEARAYANVGYQENLLKQIEAIGMQLSDEKAALARQMDARTSQPYTKAIVAVRDAIEVHRTIQNKRTAATLKVEVWRTLQANQRARDNWQGGR